MDFKLTLISIIIPAFNEEKYLPTAVKSAISQSYTKTEIIIVNDGSVDQTPIIAAEFKQKDSRIKVINQKNQGLSAARNSGIRFSEGEIIAFLDSDDWWHLQYLEKMALRLNSNKQLGISFSRVQYADEVGNLLPIYTRGHVKNIQRQDFFYMNPLSCGSNIVIKKKFLDSIGYFDESLKSVEDLDFLYRAASHSFFRISGIKEYLVYYRIRKGLTYNTEVMANSWEQFMQKVKERSPEDLKKHYGPALLSLNLFFARRALQFGLSSKISRSYLFFCLKNPFALIRLALRYPVLILYSLPKAFIKSFLPSSL